ncbi:GAF domain-containing protein [bacterium]|nr:MAG: GAF domain-containing protein [bacterium]
MINIEDLTSALKAPIVLPGVKARQHERALILDTARLIALEILPTRSGVEALRYLAEAARELTGARYAAIGVARDDAAGFSDLVTAGFSPAEQAAFSESLPGPHSEADGVLRLLLERQEPLRLQVAPESGGETFLGVPLRRAQTALGALYVTNKGGGEAFSDVDEANVQALGIHATVAIHNLHALERERSLVAGLLTAHEEERRAIAYDLHDGLVQHVLAAHIHLEAFKYSQQSGNSEKAARELAQTSRYLQESVLESRRLIKGLRSLALDDLGLAGALELLVNEEKEHAGWNTVEFRCNIGGQRFDKMLETAVYRIAQEALTNVRKHAATQWIKVLCNREVNSATGQWQLRLEVTDRGCGFDSTARAQSLAARDGIGLYSMAERTRMLHGSFKSYSVPGEGASVTALFPLLGKTGDKPDGD